MKLEQKRPGVLQATMSAVELASLIAAARWAADGAKGELPTGARSHLLEVVSHYESELARLHTRASSVNHPQ